MKSCCFIFFTLIYFATAISREVKINDRELGAVDDLIKRIRDDTWYEEEAPCLERTLSYLNHVKNLTFWATWIWEANQNPVGNVYGSTYQMGNFDQCMNPPWLSTHPHLKTQYCTSQVNIIRDTPQKGKDDWDPYSPTEQYVNTSTKWGLYFNTLHWGVCVPSSCRPRSVAKILKNMYLGSQYSLITAEPNITVEFCQVAGESEPHHIGFYLFILTILALFGIALASTIYQSKVNISEQHPDSIESIVSKAFCLKRNYNQLVRENPGEIHVMNGIRFLTASLIVLLHQVLFLFLSPIMNPINIQKDLESLPGMVFLHLEIIVDTFFAMSGLLHVKGLIGNTARQKNLFSLLWRRYLRMLGPLAITVFYMISVAKHTGSGPFWPKFYDDEPKVCSQTWRLSLLMLNTNIEEICHSVTWYISCDYQLSILGTVLFYFYQKDKDLGYTTFGIAAVISVVLPGLLTYWNGLAAMPFPDLRTVMDIRHQTSLELNYTKSYVRAHAYLVGIAMGYFMSVYKPANHREAVSTKWSLIGVAASVITMQSVMALGKFFLDREYSAFEVVLSTAFNRAIWAFGVCCVIAFCEYGTVPIIKDFLSLKAFMPLSRLSYGMYVIHPFVIQRNNFSARSPLKYDKFTMLTDTLGTVTTSLCISFAMWLLIEAPCINLSNALFANKSRNTQPTTEKKKESLTEDKKKTNSVPELPKKLNSVPEVTKKIDNNTYAYRRYGNHDDNSRNRNDNSYVYRQYGIHEDNSKNTDDNAYVYRQYGIYDDNSKNSDPNAYVYRQYGIYDDNKPSKTKVK